MSEMLVRYRQVDIDLDRFGRAPTARRRKNYDESPAVAQNAGYLVPEPGIPYDWRRKGHDDRVERVTAKREGPGVGGKDGVRLAGPGKLAVRSGPHPGG
jgi:hypothetical protein